MRACIPGAVLLALALAPVDSASSAAQPTFSARVEGVRLDVLVTDGGRPVTGLGPADFEVRDNGVPQTIDLVSLGDVQVSVIMALDLSASLVGSRLVSLQRAGVTLLEALAPPDQAALLTFNRSVVQRVPLTRDRDVLRKSLLGAAADGDTALVDASLAAMLLGDTEGGRTLVVIFSDGVDTASFTRADVAIETARRVNGVIYAVATTSSGDSRFLRGRCRSHWRPCPRHRHRRQSRAGVSRNPAGVPPPLRHHLRANGRRARRLASAERPGAAPRRSRAGAAGLLLHAALICWPFLLPRRPRVGI